MRKILAQRQPAQGSPTHKTVPAPLAGNVTETLEFELKRKIYSMAAEKAAADGVICGYEGPKALKEARQIVLQEAVVKATSFDELKAVVTMMLDSDDGLVEGLAEIRQLLGKS